MSHPVRTSPRTAVAGSAPRLEIDLSAIAANTRLLARRSTGDLMAVVKADGFGHGAVAVARTALAAGASSLGVTSIAEAQALRAAGLHAPVLSWLNAVDADWAGAVGQDVDVAIPSRDHLDALTRATIGARVHLSLDTGMGRDGCSPVEWADLCRAARMAERQGRLTVVGMMGHLPCADVPEDPSNSRGRNRFSWGLMTARAAGLRPTVRHLAATSATLLDPLAHHTTTRVGAGLVGIDPSRTTALRPALTLTAPLVEVRSIHGGTSIGYGHTWTAPGPTRLGLVPLGYADGLPRSASGRAEMQVRGERVPVVGRISMDMAVVDLGASGAEVGEIVTVFGPGDAGEPTVREWADAADVLEHEIVTGLGARVARGFRPARPPAAALRSVR
ncbi:alanine racemase [Nocardioides marmoriginsengisoli]|uniref:Alanine racemase n=1 Tax=Nocardioides marmoriginsengisoli TaxID=661483 RepID=A0A3N0CF19_9ACTN|nr:alanine racemase [Nocardioides marmoriginsengisoli]RNL62028.1 alanine racemase [Nocardioides marmoriginsengisoli]